MTMTMLTISNTYTNKTWSELAGIPLDIINVRPLPSLAVVY